MTAEVVIMNRHGVAIAADSAVTVSGEGTDKTYNANKLFALSAVEPIAVMVYGGASFGAIPWDTVVKEHRKHIREKAYDTVEEYASAFIEYLSSLVDHVPSTAQLAMVNQRVRRTLQEVISSLVAGLNSLSRQTGDRLQKHEDDVRDSVLLAIETQIEKLQKQEALFDEGSINLENQINAAIPNWSRFLNQLLKKKSLPSATDAIKGRAKELATIVLKFESPFTTGVVVAGYGKKQLFPAFCHYKVDGIIANTVRTAKLPGRHISGYGTQAVIYPFAQRDVVMTFMNGMHSEFTNLAKDLAGDIGEHTEILLDQFNERLNGTIPAEVVSVLSPVVKQIVSIYSLIYLKSMDRLQKDSSSKIMSNVQWLPKEKLAEVAETLVSLTSFHRSVTPGIETVGGPIDVAVISKGDGLIWIKQKHYFNPKLNHRYFEIDRQKYTTSLALDDNLRRQYEQES